MKKEIWHAHCKHYESKSFDISANSKAIVEAFLNKAARYILCSIFSATYNGVTELVAYHRMLVQTALERGSTDNITVLIICLSDRFLPILDETHK